MPRLRRRPTPQLAIAGSIGTASYAATAARLGWKIVAVAGDHSSADVAASVGAQHRFLDDVLDHDRADIVVVGTDLERRLADVDRLVRRGINVLMIPGRFDVTESTPAGRAGMVGVADQFSMSPAVQRWFALLAGVPGISHLGGRACATSNDDTDMVWHAASALVVATRIAGIDRAAALLDVVDSHDDSPPCWELQAASDDAALRVDMFPAPRVELNGNDVPITHNSSHPADVFGTADVLRTLADELAANREPLLGLAHAIEVNGFLADLDQPKS